MSEEFRSKPDVPRVGNAALRALLISLNLAPAPGLAASNHAPAAAERVVSVGEMVSPKNIETAARWLERKLQKGGVYDEALKNNSLTRDVYEVILNEMLQVASSLNVAAAIDQGASPLSPLFLPNDIPGIQAERVLRTDGSRALCNTSRLSVGGRVFRVTARHCVEPTYTFDSAPDIALDVLPNYTGPVLPYDTTQTDDDVAGHLVAMRTTDRFGQTHTMYAFAMKVTEPMLRIQFPTVYQKPAYRALIGQFFFVLPPEQGDAGPDGAGERYLGESGTLVFTYDTVARRFRATAPFFAGSIRQAACKTSRGVCATLAFCSGPDTFNRVLLETLKAPPSERGPQKRATRSGF